MMTLQAFALTNHEVIIDRIKLIQIWAESSRQARAACYISFTWFLNRRLQGVVKKGFAEQRRKFKNIFQNRRKSQNSSHDSSAMDYLFQRA